MNDRNVAARGRARCRIAMAGLAMAGFAAVAVLAAGPSAAATGPSAVATSAAATSAAAAGAAAAGYPAGHRAVGLDVTAQMSEASGGLGTGAEVNIAVTLENHGPSASRVLVDEVLAGVLDDARLSGAPTSSNPGITVVRIGFDRVALIGELEPGERATLDYTVVVGPAAERGDGVLSRVAVPANDEATCDSTDAPATADALGACTALVLPAPWTGTSAPSRGAASPQVSASTDTLRGASAGSDIDLALADASAVDAVASVDTQPFALIAAAGVVSIVLIALAVLISIVTRLRPTRRPPRPARPSTSGPRPLARSPHPLPKCGLPPTNSGFGGPKSALREGVQASVSLELESEVPASATKPLSVSEPVPVPLAATPQLGSRRERREAEQRLAERGLALPVA